MCYTGGMAYTYRVGNIVKFRTDLRGPKGGRVWRVSVADDQDCLMVDSIDPDHQSWVQEPVRADELVLVAE